jgi:hypothetical protein
MLAHPGLRFTDHTVAVPLDFDRYSDTGMVRVLGDVGGFDAPTGAGG